MRCPKRPSCSVGRGTWSWWVARGARSPSSGDPRLKRLDGRADLGGRLVRVDVDAEVQGLAEDDLDVAATRRPARLAVDPSWGVHLQLDRHDRDRAVDRDEAGPGLELLERPAD